MISAKVIADSVSEKGARVTTFELEYHRFIHSELMTHRMFSRNAASSRAIKIEKMIALVDSNPAIPIKFGRNQAGMQAGDEVEHVEFARTRWLLAKDFAVTQARSLDVLGVHKQIVNRVLEPFSYIKVIVTATEFDNFFELRDHEDAQPEIQELARCMKVAMSDSKPELLRIHEWHTPYVEHSRDEFGGLIYGDGLSVEEAKKVSASCIAQVSYRNLDTSLEKALRMYDRLVGSTPRHSSPFESVCSPSVDADDVGVTHISKDGSNWSGNFRGWLQFRHTH